MLKSVHVRLLVPNYSECFQFYTQILGLNATYGDEESGYADFPVGTGEFSLFVASEMAAAIGARVPSGTARSGTAQFDDRAVLVFGVESVDQACRKLQTRGVTLAAPPTDRPGWGIRTAHFRDPAGHLIEINQGL